MIDAKFYFDHTRGSVKLRLRGHANTAPRGEDLICAAASALAITAGQSAALLHKRGLLTRPPMVRLNQGDALVVVTPRQDALAETLMCFWTVQCGLFALSRQYPGCIKLTEVLKV